MALPRWSTNHSVSAERYPVLIRSTGHRCVAARSPTAFRVLCAAQSVWLWQYPEPPRHFLGGQFDGFPGFPGAAPVDHLGLVEAVDGFGQDVVVAVATAANRRFHAGLGQALRVADGDILRTSVRVMNQRIRVRGPTGLERLLPGIEHEVRGHGGTDAPADDASGEHIDDEGHI
jgi:hypothetical protein